MLRAALEGVYIRSPCRRWAQIRDLPAITSPVACQEFARPMNWRAIIAPPVFTGGPVWPSAEADGVMIARCFSSRVENHLKRRVIAVQGRSDSTVQM